MYKKLYKKFHKWLRRTDANLAKSIRHDKALEIQKLMAYDVLSNIDIDITKDEETGPNGINVKIKFTVEDVVIGEWEKRCKL